MKKILCFLGGALLLSQVHAQVTSGKAPLYKSGKIYINSRLPDLSLGQLINYKDSAANLSAFYNKIIILDFWFTQCTSCVAEFPVEIELQNLYAKDIQIIPVAYESKRIISDFLTQWEYKNHKQFSLPVIVGDSALNKYFDNIYFPHYVWILPDRTIAAESSADFINKENIETLLRSTKGIRATLRKDSNYLHKVPSMSLLQINKYYQNK